MNYLFELFQVLAKEIVNARKSVSKLYVAKAHLSSVDNNMKAQAAQLKIAGALAQSTDVMKAMQALIKLPEMSKTMQEMSKEMMKAGIIEEMMEDAMETLEDPEDLEEDVQLQVSTMHFSPEFYVLCFENNICAAFESRPLD